MHYLSHLDNRKPWSHGGRFAGTDAGRRTQGPVSKAARYTTVTDIRQP